MKTKLLIATLLLVFSFVATAQKKLNFDGYYRTLSDSLNPFSFYLRFYPDGTVIGTSTAANANNLIPWFKKDHQEVSKGSYNLRDSTIKFSLTAKEGLVQYEGILIPGNRLWLHVKSLINNYEGKEEYFFLKMNGLK
ncbi:MAG TPA: hypothetical protein VNA26_09020 [Chitinophagaceae bacterium]|nr:hypothetical protein [Chitinophagaceae bacterium]